MCLFLRPYAQAFRDAGPDPHRIAHAVDVYLERWQSAMEHLLAVDDLDAALALARDRGLLRSLLAAVPESNARRVEVLRAYAAWLESQQRHEDAALAYMAAGDATSAQRAYRAAGCWQHVLTLAATSDHADVARLAADIAAELAATHRPLEAATVLFDYCDDAENGVVQLCEGQAWREAVRQAHRAVRGDLVETVIMPAAAARVASVLGVAGDALARVDKYLQRWRDVRDKRIALQVCGVWCVMVGMTCQPAGMASGARRRRRWQPRGRCGVPGVHDGQWPERLLRGHPCHHCGDQPGTQHGGGSAGPGTEKQGVEQCELLLTTNKRLHRASRRRSSRGAGRKRRSCMGCWLTWVPLRRCCKSAVSCWSCWWSTVRWECCVLCDTFLVARARGGREGAAGPRCCVGAAV